MTFWIKPWLIILLLPFFYWRWYCRRFDIAHKSIIHIRCCKCIGYFLYYFYYDAIFLLFYKQVRLLRQAKSKCQNFSKQVLRNYVMKVLTICHKAQTCKCLLGLVKNNRKDWMYFYISLEFKMYGLCQSNGFGDHPNLCIINRRCPQLYLIRSYCFLYYFQHRNWTTNPPSSSIFGPPKNFCSEQQNKGSFYPKFHTDWLIPSMGLCRKDGGNTPSDNEEAALSIFCTACLGRPS